MSYMVNDNAGQQWQVIEARDQNDEVGNEVTMFDGVHRWQVRKGDVDAFLAGDVEVILWDGKTAAERAAASEKWVYSGFEYSSLAEAEAARQKDHGGWLDGRRKAIWHEPSGEAL